MKVNVSNPKLGKTMQKEVPAEQENALIGKKIGGEVDLTPFGFNGVKGKITGGSDKDGFPMKPEIQGTVRKKLLMSSSVGLQSNEKGFRKKKTIRGNSINDQIEQVNIKVLEESFKKAEDIFNPKEEKAPSEETTEDKAEEKTEEKPAPEGEEKKEAVEEKKEEASAPAKEEKSEEKKE